MLRTFFKYKRRLLGQLCQAAVQALIGYFHALTGTELIPGVVAVIQTFGQKINFHPHAHLLVTEGGEDRDGHFHHIPAFSDGLLAQMFAREVFSLLLREELISQALVEKIMGWRHSGFSVHSKVKVSTKEEAERVGKYMIRPVLSLERLSFDKPQGQVSYQYGKEAEDLERMDYQEFIARVTSHIPDKGQVMVRYFGLYANAHRGKMHKREQGQHKLLIIEEEGEKIPQRGWAELIRKVYETDPLICPKCQGQMRIIAFITDYPVVDRILNHLKLTFVADKPPPPRIAFQELLMAAEANKEYFS